MPGDGRRRTYPDDVGEEVREDGQRHHVGHLLEGRVRDQHAQQRHLQQHQGQEEGEDAAVVREGRCRTTGQT